MDLREAMEGVRPVGMTPKRCWEIACASVDANPPRRTTSLADEHGDAVQRLSEARMTKYEIAQTLGVTVANVESIRAALARRRRAREQDAAASAAEKGTTR